MVYKLYKAMYGLKQARRVWKLKIDSFFKHMGFEKYEIEFGVYVQHDSNGDLILVCLYVDDIFLTGSYTFEINKLKNVIMKALYMTDLGNMVHLIRMEILHSDKGIIMHQLKNELELLERFKLMKCKPIVTPTETHQKLDSDANGEDLEDETFKQLIGSLRYMCKYQVWHMLCSWNGSGFVSKSKLSHYQVAVMILRYVKGTLRYGILFPSGVSDDTKFICYSDSYWCGYRVDIRSTT